MWRNFRYAKLVISDLQENVGVYERRFSEPSSESYGISALFFNCIAVQTKITVVRLPQFYLFLAERIDVVEKSCCNNGF